ncbi:Gfo/Idh/MocA family protein [Rhodopila sp.]|uniref:Gfo/Idh/MocA family protein n=1 Tax=Rhodopila sp. TaxID=2480087 RepID=UPI002C5203D9|nr:Gfo/Idh/MocA family oxidoreductase [Rhodopila sp.]HVZ07425.1 Gfo/Idh/MocA family oxidoreductase [Rhodopila sp.]
MRIVMIGVSHWHTPFFLDPSLALPDVSVVGVSDPDISRTQAAAAKARCPAFSDYREMCLRLKPDFAFALAPHCDMAELARFLIDQRIPFAMEKPCAINAAEAADIATRAEAAGVFAAVPYVIRYSPLLETIREVARNEPVQYATFKFIGGMVDRYAQQRVEWVTDRARSGGGPLLNLGVHFLDLSRVLLGGADLAVTGAMMSNRQAHLSIEDHAVVLMQGGGASCMVETGYLYPAPNSVFDLHYSIRTENHYFAARDDSMLEIVTNNRTRSTREMKLTNVYFYPTFVRDTLRRLRDGRKPIADLSDNAAAVRLVEAAYRMSPLG